MTSRIPNQKKLDAYVAVAKHVIDPSTAFEMETVDGKKRVLARGVHQNTERVEKESKERRDDQAYP